jgi:hypothetical protein
LCGARARHASVTFDAHRHAGVTLGVDMPYYMA